MSNVNIVKEKFKTFCDGTSIHGFSELYHANNVGLAVLWIFLLSTSIGLTTYQVIKAIKQFTEQPSKTRIEVVEKNDIIYPPIKICSMHWLYWLDWNKAFSLNFTKESLLYAMSYWTNIYTQDDFDIQTAEDNFQFAMSKNKFTNMHQFYLSVAKVFSLAEDMMEYENAFKEKQIFYSISWKSHFMCYILSGTSIGNVMSLKNYSLPFDLIILLQTESFSWESQYVSLDEYNSYMLDWFMTKSAMHDANHDSREKNLSSFRLPLIMYPDGFADDSYLPITLEADKHIITLSLAVNRWFPTSESDCVVNQKQLSSKIGECLNRDIRDQATFCSHQIFKISNGSNIKSNLFDHKCETRMDLNPIIEICILPCELWHYSFTYTVENFVTETVRYFVVKKYTAIRLVYPHPSRTLIAIEIESETWEDFVANIGGLLGVYTGASLLSLVQLFYLCCFTLKQRNSEERGKSAKAHAKCETQEKEVETNFQ